MYCMGVPSRTPILDLFRPGFHALCRAYFGVRFAGVEHIPRVGAVVITPNHQTYADPPLVSIPVRRPVHYMAWDRLFEIPVLAATIRRLRAFPVRLEAADPRAAREAARLLIAGAAVMIFPEGGRTIDGSVQPFKPGAFRLAAALKAPVLPVSISGADVCWPRDRILPRPGNITITYHAMVHSDPTLRPHDAASELARRTWDIVAGGLGASD